MSPAEAEPYRQHVSVVRGRAEGETAFLGLADRGVSGADRSVDPGVCDGGVRGRPVEIHDPWDTAIVTRDPR